MQDANCHGDNFMHTFVISDTNYAHNFDKTRPKDWLTQHPSMNRSRIQDVLIRFKGSTVNTIVNFCHIYIYTAGMDNACTVGVVTYQILPTYSHLIDNNYTTYKLEDDWRTKNHRHISIIIVRTARTSTQEVHLYTAIYIVAFNMKGIASLCQRE